MERACCDNIIKAQRDIAAIDDRVAANLNDSLRWRASHAADNAEQFRVIMERLDSIDQRLTSWVNPVLSVVLTTLGTIIGILAGYIFATS